MTETLAKVLVLAIRAYKIMYPTKISLKLKIKNLQLLFGVVFQYL